MSAVIVPTRCEQHGQDLGERDLMGEGYWCVPGQHSLPARPVLDPDAARFRIRVVKLRLRGHCNGDRYRRGIHPVPPGTYVVRDSATYQTCAGHSRDDSLIIRIEPVEVRT